MALQVSPMSRDGIPDMMELGIRKVFTDSYRLYDDVLEEIYNRTGSSKRQETDLYGSGLSVFHRKDEGMAPYFDTMQEAWKKVFLHATFALGTEITEEGMEDDLYRFYLGIGREMGKAAAYTRQVEGMDLFNNLSAELYNAESTSYTLLSTAHFRVDGGTWPNRPTNQVDLTSESLETALTDWSKNMLDQRGRRQNIRPATLMVGFSDEWTAHRILMSQKRPGGNDNDPNAIRDRRSLRLFVNPFLNDDGRWFLLAQKSDTGLVYFDRANTEMRRRDDSRTGNMLMIGRYRESHGSTHPYGIYGSP